jgi:hypothetical protein
MKKTIINIIAVAAILIITQTCFAQTSFKTIDTITLSKHATSINAKAAGVAFITVGTEIYQNYYQTLTRAERQHWNGFVTYLERLHLKGSVKLDNRKLGLSERMFYDYNKTTGAAYDYKSFVTRVQQAIKSYRENALNQIRSGKAVFKGPDSLFMRGLSIVDGWAGSKTTTWRFPADSVVIYNRDGNIIGKKPNDTY